MVILSAILDVFGTYSIAIFLGFIALSFTLGFLLKRPLVLAALLAFTWLVIFPGIFWGAWLNNKFLYTYGVRSEAAITGVEKFYPLHKNLNTFPNLHYWPSYRYTVEFKSTSGTTLTTHFISDDNISFPPEYPHRPWYGRSIIPSNKGELFSIKYVPGYERNFVILADDMSTPYGFDIVCRKLDNKMTTAEWDYNRDSANPEFITSYREALENFLPCVAINDPNIITDDDDLNEVREKLEKLPPN